MRSTDEKRRIVWNCWKKHSDSRRIMVYNGGAVEHTHRFPHILSFFFSSARRVPPPPAGKYVAPQVHEPGAAPLFRMTAGKDRQYCEMAERLDAAGVDGGVVFCDRPNPDRPINAVTMWGFESLSRNQNQECPKGRVSVAMNAWWERQRKNEKCTERKERKIPLFFSSSPPFLPPLSFPL